MASKKETRAEINRISRHSGYGDLGATMQDALYGINHRGAGNAIPGNSDHYGLTFFTRPRLNLSYDNVLASRQLMPLLTDDSTSLKRAIRVMLDPEGAKRGITSPLVDNHSAFLPILTNTLLSLNGWPDVTVDAFTSKEGRYKEAYSMVDSAVRYYSTFDATAAFRNIAGDPITLLFNTWIHYASQVYEGVMSPYPDSIIENEIDYNTRIYRLILDPSRLYVQKIAACGAAFPMASPLGTAFNFSSEQPVNNENEQISVPFRCMGAEYLDPIIVEEFNKVVGVFNPTMAESEGREPRFRSTYYKVDTRTKNFFNYRGYPRIDPKTMELEWWVPAEVFAEIESEETA